MGHFCWAQVLLLKVTLVFSKYKLIYLPSLQRKEIKAKCACQVLESLELTAGCSLWERKEDGKQ